MDFIEGLPKSKGCDTILVEVDMLSKYAHFLPLSHPFTAPQVAQLFLTKIIKCTTFLVASYLIKTRCL